MPLYFFHVRDGVHLILDPDGSCLPDLASAQTEAVLSARELMSQSIVGAGRLGIERRFEIADYEGKTVAIVPFSEAVR
jgi:NADH dehydrogenase FAD-containing subunit